MMSIRALCLALVLGACSQNPEHSEATLDAASARAEIAADSLYQRLSSELASAMSSGGTVAAISVCKERAPAIASEIATETGVSIGRTALRVRNAANTPDAWEVENLEQFESRRATGEAWSDMSARTVENGALRWMRPIPMGETCASCHGSADAISEDARQALGTAYPNDRATDYSIGGLRGAFTARVPLSKSH
jgi:hypothetical protein